MHKLLLPLAFAALMPIHSLAQVAGMPTPQGVAEPAGPITLAKALALAMQANAEIAAAKREVDANDGAIRQAGIIPNPELAAQVDDTNRATRTTTLQLNQPIELGAKRSSRIAAAEYGRVGAVAELDAKRAEIRANVITSFYDILAAQERLRLAQSSVELAKRASIAAIKRVAAGKISPIEETKAKVAESSVRIESTQAASDLAIARKRLASTWGSSAPGFTLAEGDVKQLPGVPVLADVTNKLQQSPSLQRARSESSRRQALADVERSRQIGDLTVSLGAKRDEQLGRTQAIVGVSIPLPLFNRNQGNVQEAQSRAEKAQDELRAVQTRVSSELTQAYERFIAARQEAQLLQSDIVPGAQRAYEASTIGFEHGKFSFLEVLDAQRTYFQAQSQYLRVLSDVYRQAAEVDRILGTSAIVFPEQK